MRFLYALELFVAVIYGTLFVLEIVVPVVMRRRMFPIVRHLLGNKSRAEQVMDQAVDIRKDVDVLRDADELIRENEAKLNSERN